MIKNILVLCFLCVFFSGIAFCQEDIEIDSQVITINPEGEYIVIKAGKTDGVEIGDKLVVHREGEKIAEAQIIEVRPQVAAAEILNTKKEIKEGDSILIVKKAKKFRIAKKTKASLELKKPRIAKKEKAPLEQKKSKWTALSRSGAEASSAVPVAAVDSGSGTKAGKAGGAEIGGGLIAHKDGEKSTEVKNIEVKPKAATTENLNAENVIKKDYKKAKKSKWTTLLGSDAEISSAVPVTSVDSGSKTMVEDLKSGRIQVGQKSSVVRADINTNPSATFSYTLIVLRENGYSVIFSSRVTGVILATKPLELSIMSELWADATARIEHKLVVSLEFKDKTGSTELKISSFKEHTQKGKQIKFPIMKDSAHYNSKDSKYYNAMVELASKIKERAEH